MLDTGAVIGYDCHNRMRYVLVRLMRNMGGVMGLTLVYKEQMEKMLDQAKKDVLDKERDLVAEAIEDLRAEVFAAPAQDTPANADETERESADTTEGAARNDPMGA